MKQRTSSYPLSQLIDLAELQGLMEAFHRATGINHALLALDGSTLSSVGWQAICRRFHHTHPVSCKRCLVNEPLAWKCLDGHPYIRHRCRNGLYDYATPVVIDGQHMANIFTGQLLHEPPDLSRFRQQAEEFGFDENAYLDAIGQATVIPGERMPDIMTFLVCLARLLGTNGLIRLRQLEAEHDLQELNAALSQRVQERTAELSEKNRLLLQKEMRLQQSHDLLAKLSDQVPGVLFQYRLFPNGKACFPYTNQALQEIYEVSPEQVRDDASLITAFHHPDDAEGIAASLRDSARTLQSWHYEYRVALPLQGVRWRLGNARPEKLEDGSILWHGFITDITERKQLQAELEQQAQLDFLTGLANRRHFMELAERELSRALRHDTPLSALMLDIDHFKAVNDTYGHEAGDLVLRTLSEVCRATLREVDIIGRLGGEEFGILLPMTDGREALETAQRLKDRLAQTVVLVEQNVPLNFTVSIGVAPVNGKETTLDTLFHRADKALYDAKRRGRNRACADQEACAGNTPTPPPGSAASRCTKP